MRKRSGKTHPVVQNRRRIEGWTTPGSVGRSDEERRGALRAGHLGDLLEAVVVDGDDAPFVVMQDWRLRRGGQHAFFVTNRPGLGTSSPLRSSPPSEAVLLAQRPRAAVGVVQHQ